MTQKEFLTCLSGKIPYTEEEIEFLLGILESTIIEGILRDGQVKTPFGLFKLAKRKAKRIQDVRSKEIKILPPKNDIVFIPTEKIKEDING